MRLFKRFIKIFSGIVAFVFIYCAISVVAISYVDSNKRDKIIGDTKSSEGMFYFKDLDTSASLIGEIKITFSSLPENIRNDIMEKDWCFVFSKTIPEAVLPDATATNTNGNLGSLQGLTVSTAKTVFIRVSDDINLVRETFVHEIGHIVGCDLNYLYGRNEFLKIYKECSEAYDCDPYAKTNVSEFFANGFKDYILYPEFLKEQSSRMYDFYEENITGAFPDTSLKSKIINSPIAAFNLLISKIAG